jgi:hypothetical protein
MKELGVAIIGYGGVAKVHGMAYRAIPFSLWFACRFGEDCRCCRFTIKIC